MFTVAFLHPQIPPNTGNAIRLVAATGCQLHLIGPLGFELTDARLRRAGLDYHDLASVTVHADLAAAWQAFGSSRVFAFSAHAPRGLGQVQFDRGDVLLFGPEPTGLPAEVLADARITDAVRIPMLAGRRSLNLANAAAVVVYHAWAQHGFDGGVA